MHRLLDLIVQTTKIVVDLDRIIESAEALAATNAEGRAQAQILRATAVEVRADLLEGLHEVKPCPSRALTSREAA